MKLEFMNEADVNYSTSFDGNICDAVCSLLQKYLAPRDAGYLVRNKKRLYDARTNTISLGSNLVGEIAHQYAVEKYGYQIANIVGSVASYFSPKNGYDDLIVDLNTGRVKKYPRFELTASQLPQRTKSTYARLANELDGLFDKIAQEIVLASTSIDDDDTVIESTSRRTMKEARVGKMKQVYVSQEYVPGYGWEEVTEYDDMSDESYRLARQDVKDYRDNGYQARWITRRIPNTNYVEPENNISYDEAVAWIENECPYDVRDLYFSGGENYVLGVNGREFAQVLVDRDNTVRVRNIRGNRTKQVRSIDEMIREIERIANL